MTYVRLALQWLNDPVNWTGRNGVIALTVEHLAMSVVAVLVASAVALPIGIWLGHRGSAARAGTPTVVLTTVSRALPTFALLTIFASAGLGFGDRPTVLAAAVFALPVVLATTYTGVLGVDADVRDAARGMGMSEARLLTQVELPLAGPMITAGLRTAMVQVVATVPLAALVGGGGLGRIVVDGFGTQRYGQVVAGGVLVAVLCLLVEGALAVGEHVLTPRAVRALRST